MSLLNFFAGQKPKWETMSSPTSLSDVTGPLAISGSNGRSSDVIHLVGLTFVHTYRQINGSGIYCQAFTINSDGSVTWGSAVQTGDCQDDADWFALVGGALTKINDTTFTIAYRDTTGRISIRACSVSGLTITAGSELVTGYNTDSRSPVVVWSGTHILVSYLNYGGSDYYIDVLTISGTTLTYVNRYAAYAGFRYRCCLTQIPGTNNFILGLGRGDATNGWQLRHVTVDPSTGACTFGTAVSLAASTQNIGNNIILFSATEGIALIYDKTNNRLACRKFTISGTTISLGSATTVDSAFSNTLQSGNHGAFCYDLIRKRFVVCSYDVVKVLQYNWAAETFTAINQIDILPYARTIGSPVSIAAGGNRLVASMVTYSGANYYNSLAII